jgi:hypothetical protein
MNTDTSKASRERCMGAVFWIVISFLFFIPMKARGQQQDAHALVQEVVTGEVAADAHDHSRWLFRDANKAPGKSTVKLTVQTAQGNVSKTIEIDGHPLTGQERRADDRKMQQMVSDPALREKQRKDERQDSAQATAMTEMLPNAFLWTKTAQRGAQVTLSFKPNPKFKPPTREARVFAAMEGTMVVDTTERRVVSLKGKLTHEVNFGFGLLGKLQKGGTFDVERSRIGTHVWQITETHIHIQGHALIFKSISEQQDEETSNFKPSPANITLAEAAKMLSDGTVAKNLGVAR